MRTQAKLIVLSLALAACWLALSGHYEPLLLILGVVSVAFSLYIARRMQVVDHEGVPAGLSLSALRQLPWLIVEIGKANIAVARRILDPSLPITPTVFETPASQKSDIGQATYANWITLTPGTVSVDLDPGTIRVHALSTDDAAGVQTGEMDRRVSDAEKRS